MSRYVRLFAVLCAFGLVPSAQAGHPHVVVIGPGQVSVSSGYAQGTVVGYRRHRHHYDAVVTAAPQQPMYYAPQAPVAPPVPAYAPPPVVYAPPAPVQVYTPPPVVYAPVPVVVPVAPAPVVVQPAPRPVDNKPNFLALKYMPGFSSNIGSTDGKVDFSTPQFAHSPGVEFRLTRWLSLRSDLEFRKSSRTWDALGVKGSLFPRSPVKPYASVSFAISENLANPGKYSFGFAAAAGMDIFIGKYFFLEAEARYRMSPGSCCSEVPTLAVVAGGGVAFF